MNLFQTMVGIDPSGRRLALAAVRWGFGRPALCAPPAVVDLRAEKEPARREESEGILGDFVARNGLAGSAARLYVPADRVYGARVSFPPIREKDLKAALEMELERLFPFPPARLRFGWRRLGETAGRKPVTLLIEAAPSDFLDQWEESVSRAGLRLAGAIPAGWALSAACPPAGRGGGAFGPVTAMLRDVGDAVECSVRSNGVPVFTASRTCPLDAMPSEGLSLLEEGMVDVPSAAAGPPVDLIAPPGWCGEEETGGGGGNAYRYAGDFMPFPGTASAGPAGPEEGIPPRKFAGAFGAAVAEEAIDLLASGKEGAGPVAARILVVALAAAAFLLALAWPAALYWRTNAELAGLDAEVAALRPVVADVEKSVGDLSAVDGKMAVLRASSAGRGEPFVILKELTERLPDGTWLTGLRVEDRKVEMDGLSPSANEIFPILTRDGKFRGVAFVSPITRQPDNLERFRIRAEFVPESPPGEGGAR